VLPVELLNKAAIEELPDAAPTVMACVATVRVADAFTIYLPPPPPPPPLRKLGVQQFPVAPPPAAPPARTKIENVSGAAVIIKLLFELNV
jgi:hypothetical protein